MSPIREIDVEPTTGQFLVRKGEMIVCVQGTYWPNMSTHILVVAEIWLPWQPISHWRSRRWQNLHAVFSVFRPFSKLDTHQPGWLWDLITLRRDTLATQSKLQSVRTTTKYNLSTLTPFWSLGHFLSFKTKPDTYIHIHTLRHTQTCGATAKEA